MIPHNRVWKILFAMTLNAALLVSAAFATTIVRMDLATLARSAEIIVRARCIGSEARSEAGSLWTFDNFEVLETLKGSPPQTLRVRLPGGRVGHLETKVEGVPRFVVGEEVVLFLEQTAAGDCGITSWAQGTFRAHRDAKGIAHLTQDTSEFAVYDPATHQFAATGFRNLPLTEFRSALTSAMSAPLPSRPGSPR